MSNSMSDELNRSRAASCFLERVKKFSTFQPRSERKTLMIGMHDACPVFALTGSLGTSISQFGLRSFFVWRCEDGSRHGGQEIAGRLSPEGWVHLNHSWVQISRVMQEKPTSFSVGYWPVRFHN